MNPVVDVAIQADGWSRFDDLCGFARTVIAAAVRESGVTPAAGAEVSVLFCDDAFIQELNRQWRGFDRPTNVLSFPPGGAISTPALLGDIVIAFETAAAEAAAAGLSLRDHAAHLLVHGFLHLLGHDHADPAGAEAMEALERAALGRLGIADPYRPSLIEEAACAHE